MDKKINAIINKYKFDKKLRVYSDKYYLKNYAIITGIKSRKEIDDYKNSAIYIINYYKRTDSDMAKDNIIEIEKAIAKYEIAVHKVLQSYGTYDFNYTSEELQQLVDDIFKDYDLLAEINQR
jgi:hypothetical protein